MENIKIVDMQQTEAQATEDAADVKGGAAYIKFDGIDGESKEKGHDKWIDITSVSSPIYR